MKASDLSKWLESARDAGADRIEVRRARRQGRVEEKLFCEDTLENVNADSLAERMRDDAISGRKLASAEFEIAAFAGKGKEPVMRERVTVKRSDDDLDFGEDPSAKLAAVAVREMQNMARCMTDAVKGSNTDIREILGTVSDMVTKLHAQQGDVLDAMFTIASLKQEKEEAERRSADHRAMAKSALEELGPILGAIIMKLGKKSGPGLVALFKSLRDDQVDKLQAILTPEQMGLLTDLVGELDKEKKGV